MIQASLGILSQVTNIELLRDFIARWTPVRIYQWKGVEEDQTVKGRSNFCFCLSQNYSSKPENKYGLQPHEQPQVLHCVASFLVSVPENLVPTLLCRPQVVFPAPAARQLLPCYCVFSNNCHSGSVITMTCPFSEIPANPKPLPLHTEPMWYLQECS